MTVPATYTAPAASTATDLRFRYLSHEVFRSSVNRASVPHRVNLATAAKLASEGAPIVNVAGTGVSGRHATQAEPPAASATNASSPPRTCEWTSLAPSKESLVTQAPFAVSVSAAAVIGKSSLDVLPVTTTCPSFPTARSVTDS